MKRLATTLALCAFVASCGGSAERDASTDAGAAKSVLVPCAVQFGGVASGTWHGTYLASTYEPANDVWEIGVVVKQGEFSNASNVKSMSGGLTIRGMPRVGTFSYDTVDLETAAIVASLEKSDTLLVTIKDRLVDGGTFSGGAATLVVSSTTVQADGAIRITGSLDATLMFNDPQQTTPAATLHATF